MRHLNRICAEFYAKRSDLRDREVKKHGAESKSQCVVCAKFYTSAPLTRLLKHVSHSR